MCGARRPGDGATRGGVVLVARRPGDGVSSVGGGGVAHRGHTARQQGGGVVLGVRRLDGVASSNGVVHCDPRPCGGTTSSGTVFGVSAGGFKAWRPG